MANLTLKRRGVLPLSRKSDAVQRLTGKSKQFVFTEFCIPDMVEHYKLKPKTFSVYNWMFPYLVSKGNNEIEAKILYDKFKQWLTNQSIEVEIKISSKLQHLAMCFDFPHFSSCGNSQQFDRANTKMVKPHVFCIFTRDRRGLINNRCICEHRKSYIAIFSFYGSNYPLAGIFKQILAEKSGLPVKEKGSWL